MKRTPTTPPPTPGEIREDAAYTLAELQRRLGGGYKLTASLRRAGLPVKYIGRAAYVSGRDFCRFIDALPTDDGRASE